MTQRKILTIFIYTVLLLFIGRNLTILPTWQGLSKEKDFSGGLKEEVEKLLEKKKGSYSVYYKNLNRDEEVSINAETTHIAASVNKVPIVLALYELAEKGDLDLNDQITLQEVDIQDYGTGTLRYQKPGQTYSLRTLAKLSLKQSDNTAAHILKNTISEQAAQDFLNKEGLSQTSIINNTTSARDMGILFAKLYAGEILTEGNTKEVLGFMTDTDIEDRLPKNIDKATIYHKTGDEVGTVHDVGIIEKDGTKFFIAVMASDVGGQEGQTKNLIAEISAKITSFLTEHE